MVENMTTAADGSRLVGSLEQDYRQLAHDARKADGLVSFFGSSNGHPDVKESAERTLLLLRGLKERSDPAGELKASKVGWSPGVFSCFFTDSTSGRWSSRWVLFCLVSMLL